jgi:hypothetical protein
MLHSIYLFIDYRVKVYLPLLLEAEIHAKAAGTVLADRPS